MDSRSGSSWGWGCGTLAVGALVIILLMFVSGAEVSAGYVGVVGSAGSVDVNQQPLPAGFHFLLPIVQHVDGISTQPQNHQFSEVAAASKELQNVYVDGGVNYVVDSKSAARIVIEGGLDAVISKVFDPAFQDYMKEVVPTYTTVDILSHRSDIREAVKGRLTDKAAGYGITVVDVFITNIHFDQAYTQAIEHAAAAQQDLVRARTEAQATVAKAQGQADANRALQASLSDQVLQSRALDNQATMIAKWDGKLPTYTGAGSPFIGLTAK